MTTKIIEGHLVVKADNPGQLRTLFPTGLREATVKGETWSAMPHTVEVARILNNIGIPAPSPIRSQYPWPGRYTPRWYQEDTAEFFTLNMRSYCHSACRTGKTLSALWAADYLRKAKAIRRTLIVAPLSTIYDVWENNIFESFPLRTFCVLHGSREKRLKLLAEPHDFYIINHHGLKIVEPELAKRDDIDMVVIDECFPAGTKVLTSTGGQCIETLGVGDDVVTSWGVMPVTHVFRKTSRNLVKITFEDGTYVTCTEEHPFATDKGWTRAKELGGRDCITANGMQKIRQVVEREGKGKDMRCVQERVPSSHKAGKVQTADHMLPHLLDDMEMGSEERHYDGWVGESHREENRQDSVEQRHTCYAGSNSQPTADDRRSKEEIPRKSRRERDRTNEVRSASSTTPTTRVRARRGNTNEDETRDRISDLLQSGLWQQTLKDSSRSGRVEPRVNCEKGAGQEEREVPGWARVVSVQNIECSGDVDVWNLEVEGPENYIADGKVVHNCAVFRNSRSKTLWKPLNTILNRQGIVRGAWGLTGTPTPNEPTDAFGQCKLITPENYKSHFTSFKHETMMQLAQFKWVAKKNSAASVARILKPSIRFERSVCTDMEPCYIERRAQLSAEQQKAYKQLINQACTEVANSTVTAVNAAVLLSKLVQVSCGAVIGVDGKIAKMDFGPRLAVLEELIEENNEKVVVLVPFTGVLDALATELRKKWTVGIVDGRVSAGKRTQIFRDFRETKDPHIILAHPQVLAHGLDLTAASLIVHYAPTCKAEVFQQANARIDGSKQTVKIDIAQIYAVAEEKRIYSVLKSKGRLQDIVLALSRDGK